MSKVNSRSNFLVALSHLLPEKPIGVEIGVLKGDFSEMILLSIRPKYLYLIDPYEIGGEKYESGLTTAYSTEEDYWMVLKRFEKEIKKGQVRVRRQHSYNATRFIQNKSIDFCYLDGSHLKKDVKKDLTDWLPKLKDDGILAGHDYSPNPEFGVIEAVDEFMNEFGLEMIILNENGGDYALKRKK